MQNEVCIGSQKLLHHHHLSVDLPPIQMGSSKCLPHSISLYILLVSVIILLTSPVGLCLGCYKRIFSFGDSIIDSGNFVHMAGKCQFTELPYGMTYFKHPTGRISDGRILVDFYAQALGLPLIPPNLPKKDSERFPNGANFAVLSATALPPGYFKRWNHSLPVPFCLEMQIGWFKEMLQRIAPGDGARRLLSESLIVLGEIGGNDYNFWFGARRPREVAYQFIPDVVAAISYFARDLINLGAKTILIPGNFPIGCVPEYLSGFRSDNPADYDELRCLKWFNDFSKRHNRALSDEVNRLKSQHPRVKLIYADYYGAAMQFVKDPHIHSIGDPLVACCGGNGPYNTGSSCNKTAVIHGNPGNFANWDGVHMTDKAYNIIANGVLRGPFANPPLLSSC